MGLNKKCWILNHQAIAHSQLLGFHRPERLSASESEQERSFRIQSWLLLCSGDVYLSLLLGLPYAADGRTIPIERSRHNATVLLQHNLILLSAKVIDRNQRGLSLCILTTDGIQKEVEEATTCLGETFWDSPAALARDKISREQYLENIAAQCWLYQILLLLHMPLMILSVKDVQLEKHRTACLDAARRLLKTYHIMRSDTLSAFSMVKLVDYQAFVASALLILGLLGYGSFTHEAASKDRDQELINLTITTLRQASGTVNNQIALQAVQGIEDLTELGKGGCEPEQLDESGLPVGGPYAKISVPYVGIITISPGEYYTNPVPDHVPPAIDHHRLLDFKLSRELQPILGTGTGVGSDYEPGEDFNADMTSIDFDWASSVIPHFEDDWAWINNLNY